MTEPPHAPEWIDFTPSDPGITVLQLFAYLGETLLGLALIAACYLIRLPRIQRRLRRIKRYDWVHQ